MLMRKIYLQRLGACCLMLFAIFFFIISSEKKTPGTEQSVPIAHNGPLEAKGEEDEDGMQQAMDQEFMLTRDLSLNRVPTERLTAAAKYRDQLFTQQTSNMRLNSPVPGISWTERGPNNVGGRTRALLYDMNGGPGFTKVWAGGVGGGLWVTNDITAATPVWNKVNDMFGNIAI